MPGAVFGLQAVVLLWLLRPDWVESNVGIVADKQGIGFVVAGLLGSGALGFVFAVIHHGLHWNARLSPIDYGELIRSLARAGAVNVVALDKEGKSSSVDPDTIDRGLGWAILSSVWYSAESKSPIRRAERRIASLSDTVHSVGTARVAAIGALVVALVVASRVSVVSAQGWPLFRFVVAMCWGIVVVVFFHRTYSRTGALAQSIIEQVFANTATLDKPSVFVRGALLPNRPLQPTSGAPGVVE
jgi:hypothetical protein